MDTDPMLAVSQRYCDHMNRDHPDAVLYYVQYFAKDKRATTARMLAVDSRGIEISYQPGSSAAAQRCRVEIDPPLKDPGEGRSRLIEMYHEALEGLGYSKFKADVYEGPDAFEWLPVVATAFACFLFLGSTAHLLAVHPSLVTFRDLFPRWFQIYALAAVPFFHIGEQPFLMAPILKKYRVSKGNRVRWHIHGLISGGPSFLHFRRLARAEVKRQQAAEEAKGAKSH